MPNLQTTDLLSQLDFSARVAKRAQYEAFEFTIEDEGVRVRNNSHADPAEHEYRVQVSDGLPASCTCPADDHYDGACKHRVAVAMREPILTAATAEVAADGDAVVWDEPTCEDDLNGPECEDCREALPCWECVRTGWRALPD